jgi:hypothetical protein
MEKSFITLSITFLIAFTAFGQSIEINPIGNGNTQIFTQYGNNSALISRRANGTHVSPIAVGADNTLFFLGGYGHTGTAFPVGSNVAIRFKTSQAFSPTANGTYISFFTTANNTTSLLESMRIENNGNVGIGTTTPNGRLQFKNEEFNRKIVLHQDANINNDHQFLGFGVNNLILRYQIPGPLNNHVFFAGSGVASSTELMRITGTGNVGIGTQTPNGNLSFSNTNNNRKILLYEDANNDHQFLGFGVNPQTLRYQIPSTTNSHVFYVGTSPTTSTELMRITGTGNVGIGTTTPTAKLEVNGFTKLGTDAPAIKVKKYLSTTALTQGGTATIAHGLTYAKIISATVLVEASQGKLFPPNITRSPNVQYDYDIDGTNIYVTNMPGNSLAILDQRLIIMITYEE